MEENHRMKSEVTYTQWPNWVMLRTSLVQEVDTDDDSDVSWEWPINEEWIRLEG